MGITVEHGDPPSRPFDWKPLATVSFCLAVNTYTLSSLFPYVGFMVAGFKDYSADRAGFLAGYVASSFTLGRTLSSYWLGWMADRFGRKPVMICSMLSIATFSIIFGISDSLTWAVTSRLLLGLTNGAVSTGRALVPELAGQERVVASTSYLSGARAIGMTFGPACGGLLSQPTKHFPSLFPAGSFLHRYPFLLPNVVGASFALIALVLFVIFVPETKPMKPLHISNSIASGVIESDRMHNHGNHGIVGEPQVLDTFLSPTKVTAQAMSDSDFEPAELERGKGRGKVATGSWLSRSKDKYELLSNHSDPTKLTESAPAKPCRGEGSSRDRSDFLGLSKILEVPNMPVLLMATLIHATVLIGFDEAFPLWALSSHGAGGLEWNSVEIGQAYAIGGIGVIIYQFGIHSWFVKKIGIVTMQRLAGVSLIIMFLLMPNLRYLSWNASSLLVIGILLLAFIESTKAVTAIGITLASTNPVPPSLRGKLSGLFLTSQSIGRTIGPASWSNLFAWSISASGGGRIPAVDYRFVFVLSALLMVLVVSFLWRILTEEAMTVVKQEPPSLPSSTQSRTSCETPPPTRTDVNS